MENIILTNNKDLRLVSVKVGVLSTLRFELPLVSASATRVEVIVTSGNVHSAYTATFIDATKRWQCDIAASQFPEVGKQSYEVAYVLDGKQFWDGKGWIEIEDATTSGIEPQPRPEPYRYAVVSVNGYGADAQGAVRIPKTVIATNSPATTEGYMEGDIYFNRETGATWTLCDVQGTLTWVLNKGVMTVDPTVTRNSQNPVSGGGIWSAIWGALTALPTGFSSLYDWVVAQLAGKVSDTRKVNGKALSSNVELDAGDVGAYPATDTGEGEYESDKDLYVNGRTRGEHVQARSPSDDTDWCDVATLLHIADEFDPQEQYAKDALVTFREDENWKLYKCVAANGHTGNWNPNDFQEATVEDVLAALRTGKQNALSAQQLANIAAVPSKADASAIPYALVVKTIDNGAVSLDDRASNAVTVSATLSPNTLTINFPTAPTGKLRDFAMRLNIAAGVTAPEIAWPQGVTLENNGGEVPEIADGGTGGSSTILYFSESENNGTTAKFTVKSETLTAIAQA